MINHDKYIIDKEKKNMEKIALCACSGMNPRGQVARAAVNDLSEENENNKICCIVATAGGKQKYIDLAQNHKIIAINGCTQNCTTTLLKQKQATVNKVIIVPEVLEKEGLKPENTVRMNENDEKCVDIIKKEILKVRKELTDE